VHCSRGGWSRFGGMKRGPSQPVSYSRHSATHDRKKFFDGFCLVGSLRFLLWNRRKWEIGGLSTLECIVE
jgi:hypothetical protein